MYLVLKLCCIIMDIVNMKYLSRSSIHIGQNYTIKLTCQCSPCRSYCFCIQSVITLAKKNCFSRSSTLGKSWKMPLWFQAQLSPGLMRFTSTIPYFSSVQLYALLSSVVGAFNYPLFFSFFFFSTAPVLGVQKCGNVPNQRKRVFAIAHS